MVSTASSFSTRSCWSRRIPISSRFSRSKQLWPLRYSFFLGTSAFDCTSSRCWSLSTTPSCRYEIERCHDRSLSTPGSTESYRSSSSSKSSYSSYCTSSLPRTSRTTERYSLSPRFFESTFERSSSNRRNSSFDDPRRSSRQPYPFCTYIQPIDSTRSTIELSIG